mmetsp:Transcript_112826/g.325947  ORF Transcript_112826/g.325947 Transcript_112826/m.325947 type:complete len:149 (+) Transcript_112826:97-543(+)|eukprot:CAMPEP_0176066684 /NCGR_PEP_ID=MMETSP0120_2-20121206/33280_1 /TAXON_ID=160619 /ORGANISM="Kryptoperidinium foliaceum, Strain CCMP 1326" /LENGTH=148 /DNA_ID=CAMNT_0017400293 /DNA_START=74 /DNA_END=520 /DNA_ORIENTATION=-
MPREYRDLDELLPALTDLYEKSRERGTVRVLMKRYVGRLAAVRRKRPERQAEAAKGEEPRLLVRIRSNEPKSKMTCVIGHKDLVKFQLALGNIMRANMDGMKKRQRTQEEKRQERAERKKAKRNAAKTDAADAEPKASPKKEAGAKKK